MEYHLLCDKKEYMDAVAYNLYTYYPRVYQRLGNIHSVEDMKKFLERYCSNKLPFGIIATDPKAKKFVGFISVENNGAYPKMKELWLTNLYVAKEYRKQGIGSSLVRRMNILLANQVYQEKVYLWSDDVSLRNFYKKLDFVLQKTIQYEGFEMDIYKAEIYPTISLLQPVHLYGLIVIIMLFVFFKAALKFFYRLLFDWRMTK